MFWVVLGCAWSFGLFYVGFGSTSELGCFMLVQAVLGLLNFALYCVLFFEVPLTFRLFQVVPSCSNLFLIVLSCFSMFLVVFDRLSLVLVV